MAKTKKAGETEIKELIKELRKYDNKERNSDMWNELKDVKNKLVNIGKPAVPYLIELLSQDTSGRLYAADALGEIGNKKAISPLINVLEDDSDIGDRAKEALKKFGEMCIPDVIKKVEYRISHPIKTETNTDMVTGHALSVIGEIRCEKSIEFLNKLLEDYLEAMPLESFDMRKHDWKFKNVNFFHLIDCMVKQQNEKAISSIRKAQGYLPESTADYKICQIAIGRIKKKRPDEGYLPLEALEIAMPSGEIMKAISGGELGWDDTFDEDYGEYFKEDMFDNDTGRSSKRKGNGRDKRELPLYRAVYNDDADDNGTYAIMIAREKPEGNLQFIAVLVDLWKRGLKDCYGSMNLSKRKFNESIKKLPHIKLIDADLNKCKKVIKQGLRIAEALDAKIPDDFYKLKGIVGNLDDISVTGSIYKCHRCGGDISDGAVSVIKEMAQQGILLEAETGRDPMMTVPVCDKCGNK